jgi:D-alanine-D-alanine ligase-like ATP-grasp enzyme
MDMPLRRLVCYYDSRQRWLSNPLRPDLAQAAISELAYLMPREVEVHATFEAMEAALSPRGVSCELIEAHDDDLLSKHLATGDTGTVFFNMTDGFAPLTGSYFPAFAAMRRAHYFGNSPALQLMVQNKYLQYIACDFLGVRAPETFLFDGDERISQSSPPPSIFPVLVKPFDLANSIGIFTDCVCDDLDSTITLCKRIKAHYQTKALVQRYIPGRSIRVNYVAVNRDVPIHECIGVHHMQGPQETEEDFSTFERHLELFQDADEAYAREAVPSDMTASQEPHIQTAVAEIRAHTAALVRHLGLRDFFSMDYRITDRGEPYFIELNTLPFTRNAGLRAYCKTAFGLDVGQALAEAIVAASRSDARQEW